MRKLRKMEKKKIKLSADQIQALMVEGKCSIVGSVYEVSGIEGLYVRFDEGGELSKVSAPVKRPVGIISYTPFSARRNSPRTCMPRTRRRFSSVTTRTVIVMPAL